MSGSGRGARDRFSGPNMDGGRIYRARGLRHVRHPLPRTPRPASHPHDGGLHALPASQGLPAHRVPGRHRRGQGVLVKLSVETQTRIRDLKDKFPIRRSAVLPSLHYAQAELGYLDDATLIEVAELLEVPASMTNEVVSFYTMFDRE